MDRAGIPPPAGFHRQVCGPSHRPSEGVETGKAIPELITHGCSAILAWKFTMRKLSLSLVVLGAFLPDLTTRSFGLLWPDSSAWVKSLHEPIPLLLVCFVLSRFLVPDERHRAWASLYVGVLLHCALDLCQSHLGMGYQPLFPFLMWSPNFGVFGPEATIPWLPLILAATAVLLAVPRFLQHVRVIWCSTEHRRRRTDSAGLQERSADSMDTDLATQVHST